MAYHAGRVNRQEVQQQLTTPYASATSPDFERRVRELDAVILR